MSAEEKVNKKGNKVHVEQADVNELPEELQDLVFEHFRRKNRASLRGEIASAVFLACLVCLMIGGTIALLRAWGLIR